MTVARLLPFGFRAVARGATFAGALLLAAGPSARANPSGEQVVAGSASFSRSGNTLQITTSDRVIINWQDFSINAGELTKFLQPGADSAALNKVISGNPSSILGSLQANGRIYLVNPNGIMVGGGATINCGAFIASTLDINNAEFLAGGDLHLQGNSTAAIVNQGRISAGGGDVFLIARQVDNQGTISAPNGVVGLAAGNEVLLAESGAERLFVRPTASDGAWNLNGVRNAGTLEGAQAELKAHGNIYAFAINNEGVVRATGVETRDGRVLLTADDGLAKNTGTIVAESPSGSAGHAVTLQARAFENRGAVHADGARGGSVDLRADYLDQSGTVSADGLAGDGGTVRLDANVRVLLPSTGILSAKGRGTGDGGRVEIASGGTMILSGKAQATSEGGAGGAIHATAPRLGLAAAEFDASGATRGGEILVGGGARGDGPILNSQYTLVNPYTTLRADATVSGDGGTVVVWSDGRTDFAGTLSARGGASGGNGGWAEVSGLQGLSFDGTVDLSAPLGDGGTLLLDPKNVLFADISERTMPLALALTNPAPGAGDQFGQALDADGSRLLVGAPSDDELAADAGRAFVFNGVSGALELTLTKPSPAAGDNFGAAVLVGVLGYVVGAPSDDTGATDAGAVYLFDQSGALQHTIVHSTGGAEFGGALAQVSPQLLAIGAPGIEEVRVYQMNVAPVLQTTILDPESGIGSRFGQTLAGGLERLWVGAPLDDSGGTDAGIVYQFDPMTGSQLLSLTAPSPTAGDHFGAALGLVGSGHLVAVGAPGATVSGQNGAGAVHVFEQVGGAFAITLENPEPHANDHFGAAVGSSPRDLLVGAPDSDVTAADAGAVYVFDSNVESASFGAVVATIHSPNGQAGDRFGAALVAYGPEGRVAVSAPGLDSVSPTAADSGAVYVYRELRGSATYGATPLAFVNPDPNNNDAFGAAMAAGPDFVVVGAPFDDAGATDAGSVYVFDGLTGGLSFTISNPEPAVSDHFGKSVAANANAIAVGAPNKQVSLIRPGRVYSFDNGGTYQWTFNSSSPEDNGEFGFSLSFQPHGNGLIVGAPGETVAGYPAAGRAYGFDVDLGTLMGSLEKPMPLMNDRFGHAVAFGEGGLLYVGAPQDDSVTLDGGAVYAFNGWGMPPYFQRGEWTSPMSGDQFGAALVTANGTLFVGAPGRNAGAGAVSALSGERGMPLYEIQDPHATAGDGFGSSLDAWDQRLLVGAPGDDTGASDAGMAYLLRSEDGALIAAVGNPSAAAGESFGRSVALFRADGGADTLLNDSFVVGAEMKVVNSVSAGAAFLYLPTQIGVLFQEAPGVDVVLDVGKVAEMLANEINLRIQANNDITIQDPIVVAAEGGSVGSFTLQAGRSIFINADVTTDGGAFTAVANERLNNGVHDAYRESGNAVITMAPGTTLDVGMGNAEFLLNDGQGLTYGGSGDLTLASITANSLTVQHLGPTANGSILRADATSLLTANGAVFRAVAVGGAVGAAAAPLRLEALHLDVTAPSGGAFFSLPNSGVTLGYSMPGAFLGLNGIETVGPFELAANGDVFSYPTSTFNLPGTVTISTGGNNLDLGNASAVFGTLQLTAADVTVKESGVTELGNSTITGSFTLESAGAVQSAPVSVGGIANFITSGDVTLSDPGNWFEDAVSFNVGGNVALVNQGPVLFGASTIVGNLDVTAGGAITQTGALTVNAPSVVTLTAGATDNITLDDSGNDFAAVAFGGGNDVKVVNSGPLALGASTISGNLEVTAGGAITQTGAILASGSGTSAILSAGAANNILLDNPLNDWNTVQVLSGNDVRLSDVNDLDLGVSIITGALTVNAGGSIVQSGALEVMGTASFATDGLFISLLNVLNAFHGAIDFLATDVESGYVEVINSLPTILGASDIENDFSLVSNGTITQTGGLDVRGRASFDASGNNIVLDMAANSFGSVAALGADVTLEEGDDTELAGVFAGGLLNIGSGGAITQTDDLGADHLILRAPNGAITLTREGNRIGTLDQVLRGGDFALVDGGGGLVVDGPVNLGTLANHVLIRSVNGDLTLGNGAMIGANGAGNEIQLVTDAAFINEATSPLALAGGSRFLIYSVQPESDTLNGLTSDFVEHQVSWPTAPLPANVGNGFLYSDAPPPPPSPPADEQTLLDQANSATSTFAQGDGGGGTLYAMLTGGADAAGNVGGGAGGAGGAGDGGGDGNLAGGSSLGEAGEGGGQQAQAGAGGAGGASGLGNAPSDPANDRVSVPAGGGMRMGAQGLNGMSFQQMPQTLQRAISLQIRNQLQSAIGNF